MFHYQTFSYMMKDFCVKLLIMYYQLLQKKESSVNMGRCNTLQASKFQWGNQEK